MSVSNVVFLFVLTLGAGFFALNVQRLVSYMRLGEGEDRTDHLVRRLENLLTIGIAQRKMNDAPLARSHGRELVRQTRLAHAFSSNGRGHL